MFRALWMVVAGYVCAVLAATVTQKIQVLVLFDRLMPAEEFILTASAIGIFGVTGVALAVIGRMLGWTRGTTYAAGGVLTMVIAVAAFMAWLLVAGPPGTTLLPDPQTPAQTIQSLAALIGMGLLPGLAGGLTFWLTARPPHKTA